MRIIENENRKFESPDLNTCTELNKIINHMINSFTYMYHIHNHKNRNVWVHKYF